jgi:hypothetical protein
MEGQFSPQSASSDEETPGRAKVSEDFSDVKEWVAEQEAIKSGSTEPSPDLNLPKPTLLGSNISELSQRSFSVAEASARQGTSEPGFTELTWGPILLRSTPSESKTLTLAERSFSAAESTAKQEANEPGSAALPLESNLPKSTPPGSEILDPAEKMFSAGFRISADYPVDSPLESPVGSPVAIPAAISSAPLTGPAAALLLGETNWIGRLHGKSTLSSRAHELFHILLHIYPSTNQQLIYTRIPRATALARTSFLCGITALRPLIHLHSSTARIL